MAAWLLVSLVFAGLIALQPRLGFYALIGTVGIDGMPFDPLMAPMAPLFQPLPVLATPLELLVLWTLVIGLVRGQWRLPNGYALAAAAGFIVLIIIAVERGVSRGSELSTALWEIRGILTVLPMMILVSSLQTSRREIQITSGVLVGTLVIMTGEYLWRYFSIVKSGDYGGPPETAYGHDGMVIVALLFVGAFCWCLWGPNTKHRLCALAVCVMAAALLLVSRRRAALVVAELGLLGVGLVLFLRSWKQFLLVTPLLAIVCAVYLLLFWNNPNSLGQPARAFRTVFQSQSVTERDKASDEYRRREKLNVWWTIQAQPLTGIGFGQPYPKPLPMPDLSSSWPFWATTPHNGILAIWLKAGVLALVAFWILIGSGLSQTVSIARQAKDPLLLTVSTCAAIYFVMLCAFSYVDIGLSSFRLMVLLGLFVGAIRPLRMWLAAEQTGVASPEAALPAGSMLPHVLEGRRRRRRAGLEGADL
jgi:O-antigen ligase